MQTDKTAQERARQMADRPRGRVFPLVSDEDSDIASGPWYYSRDGYVWACPKGKLRKHKWLHRDIAQRMCNRPLLSHEVVDHIDGDRLNNRRENLRVVTVRENARNLHRPRNSTGFFGVRKDAKGRKYYAAIQVDGKTLQLGGYLNPEDAARAYDKAAELHGFLTRNFRGHTDGTEAA